MKPMHKVSAAVLIAAMTILPATGSFAAGMAPQANAPMAANAMAAKTAVVPAATLKSWIGKWTPASIKTLGSAKNITVIDTKTLYKPADLKTIASAEGTHRTSLDKLHAAINADAGLKAWFGKNNVDVNRVVAYSQKGTPEVFLY
ncbi:MAG TPA: hypothetical protein VGM83_19235 [Devosiaceae bacterium]|jgi:hypothetical protein